MVCLGIHEGKKKKLPNLCQKSTSRCGTCTSKKKVTNLCQKSTGGCGTCIQQKMWYLYAMENYSAIKKNELLPFVTTWMNVESIMLIEISQMEKDKYRIISLYVL